MKRLCIFVLFISFFVSCSGGTQSSEDRGLVQTTIEGLTLQSPANWTQLAPADLPIPKSGELVLALASPEEKKGYINNLVVLSSQSKNTTRSEVLVKSNIGLLKQNMTSFNLENEKEISFLDGGTGTLIFFSGKYNMQTPNAYYLQTARNCGDTDFFITLSLAEELENYDAYEYILQSLSCS